MTDQPKETPALRNDLAPEGALSVAMLEICIVDQLRSIRDSKLTLTAAFNAIRNGQLVKRFTGDAVEDLGLTIAPGEKPVDTLEKILAAAEKRGIQADKLKAALPDIREISGRVHKQQAGPYKAVKIAREYLRHKG